VQKSIDVADNADLSRAFSSFPIWRRLSRHWAQTSLSWNSGLQPSGKGQHCQAFGSCPDLIAALKHAVDPVAQRTTTPNSASAEGDFRKP
jgi:hypothetical protein